MTERGDFLLKIEAEMPIHGKRAAELPLDGYRKGR